MAILIDHFLFLRTCRVGRKEQRIYDSPVPGTQAEHTVTLEFMKSVACAAHQPFSPGCRGSLFFRYSILKGL